MDAHGQLYSQRNTLKLPFVLSYKAGLFLALLLTILPLCQLQANTGQADHGSLKTQYRWLVDSASTLAWQQAAHRLQNGEGLPLNAPLYQVGFAPIQYWAMVEIQAPPHTPLMLQMAPWAQADCYQLPDGALLGQSGYQLPISQLHHDAHASTFRLQIPASGKLKILLRSQLDHGFYTTTPSGIWVSTVPEYQVWEEQQWFWQGTFMAFLLLLIIYHGSFFLATNDNTFGLYTMFMLGMTVYDFGINGFLTRWIWPENIAIGRYWFAIQVPMVSICQMFYCISYLKLKERAPRLVYLFRLLMGIDISILLFGIWAYTQSTDWTLTISVAMQLNGLLHVLALIGAGFYSVWLAKRQNTQIWISISWVLISSQGWVMLSAVLLILQAQQAALSIPLTTPEILKICLGLQAITLSLGLLLRYRQLQQEEQRQEQVYQALEEMSHLKDRLFSVIAHDMKNPLSSLESYFELMLHYPIPEAQQQTLTQQADRSIKRMSHLLENLLAWSSTQMEQTPYRPEQLNLIDLGKRNIELLGPLAQHKDIRLDIRTDTLPYVLGDMGMIDFIVRNLLHNAIKYTPEGKDIWLHMQVKNQQVRVAVIDQGLGIPAERVAQLRVQQRNTSTLGTNQEKGSGLGIMLCQEFLRWHGTQLHIHSIPGQGSSFSFSLPAYQTTPIATQEAL